MNETSPYWIILHVKINVQCQCWVAVQEVECPFCSMAENKRVEVHSVGWL